MAWFALNIWSAQSCRQCTNSNNKQQLSVSSSEAELCLHKASIKSLNAATNSDENSNRVLDKLRAEKWAKEQAVACLRQGATWPLLEGREDASFFTCVYPMALEGSYNGFVTPYRNGKERICSLLLSHVSLCKREWAEEVSCTQSPARPCRTGCPSPLSPPPPSYTGPQFV